MNNKTNSYKLSDQQIEFYNEKGYLIISDLLTDDEKRDAIKAAAEIKAWPETAGKWMHYYERTSNGRQLCRTENFTPYHEGVLQLVLSEKLIGVLETLIKEPVVIFKEKINYKLPGGGGTVQVFISFILLIVLKNYAQDLLLIKMPQLILNLGNHYTSV